jgi:nitroreductase
MDLDEAIRKRHMVRKYRKERVSDSLVKKLLFNARQAPSAGFMQPAEWIVVESANQKGRLARAALSQMFIADAPVVIVAVANTSRSAERYGRRGIEFYSLIDTAYGVENMLLTARSEGLGAAFVGAFDDSEVAKILDLPEDVRPIGIIAIGWSDEPPTRLQRLSFDDIVHKEKW